MPSMTPSIADCHFRSSRRSRSASERGGRRARVDEGEASVVSDTVVLVSRRSSELILALRRRRVDGEGKNWGVVVVAGAASRRGPLLDGDWFGEGVLRRSSSGTSRDFGGGVDGRAGGSGSSWSLRGRGGTAGGRDTTEGAFDGPDAGTALAPVAEDGSVYGRTSAADSRAS